MSHFPCGGVVISIGAQQMWGHCDSLRDTTFSHRYPDARAAQEELLAALVSRGIGASWAVPGGFSLASSDGSPDARFQQVPEWRRVRIPQGNQESRPFWYNQAFVRRLIAAPEQEIALSGGISSFNWCDARITISDIRAEIAAGVRALRQLDVEPVSFAFPGDLEAHHAALPEAGIRCYRGRQAVCGDAFFDDGASLAPLVFHPIESLPGLWNIPASLSISSLSSRRGSLVPLKTRLEQARLGLEAARRSRAIFHLSLKAESLAESVKAMSVFEQLFDEIAEMRLRERIEVLTMRQALDRVEETQPPAAATATDAAHA